MRYKVRSLLMLGAALGLSATLAGCNRNNPATTTQQNMAQADWPPEAFGMTNPNGTDALPPLPSSMPMSGSGMVTPASGYAGGYRHDTRSYVSRHGGGYDTGPGYGGQPGYYQSRYSYGPQYGDGPDYGYAPRYYDDSYYRDADGPGWYDEGAEARDDGSYALIALAAALGGVLGNAPPDYAFGYGGTRPWVWETGDHYRRYAEPIPGGYRYYYYAPGQASPFLVRDPYYSYSYRNDQVVYTYDNEGRIIDPQRGWRQRDVGRQYLTRGYDLYRASQQSPRLGVAAPLWAQRQAEIAREQAIWDRAARQNSAWRQWDRSHGDVIAAHWAQENAVRHYAANRFNAWRQADFRGPAPNFYAEAARDKQLRQSILAQQASFSRQADFQRRAEQLRLAAANRPLPEQLSGNNGRAFGPPPASDPRLRQTALMARMQQQNRDAQLTAQQQQHRNAGWMQEQQAGQARQQALIAQRQTAMARQEMSRQAAQSRLVERNQMRQQEISAQRARQSQMEESRRSQQASLAQQQEARATATRERQQAMLARQQAMRQQQAHAEQARAQRANEMQAKHQRLAQQREAQQRQAMMEQTRARQAVAAQERQARAAENQARAMQMRQQAQQERAEAQQARRQQMLAQRDMHAPGAGPHGPERHHP